METKITLSTDIINIIKEVVKNILDENNLSTDEVIKDKIFNLLENKCTVVYYPLQNEKNRGFHIKRLVNDKVEDFVYINTDKTVEQLVFTAAHEFGHVNNVYEKVKSIASDKYDCILDTSLEYEETIIDRFAAELIMPEHIFKRTIEQYVKDNNLSQQVSVINILMLINVLMVEYICTFDAVCKRLEEVDFIDEKTVAFLRGNTYFKQVVEAYNKEKNVVVNGKSKVIGIPGLRELLEKASNMSEVDKDIIKIIEHDFCIEKLDIADSLVLDEIISIRE